MNGKVLSYLAGLVGASLMFVASVSPSQVEDNLKKWADRLNVPPSGASSTDLVGMPGHAWGIVDYLYWVGLALLTVMIVGILRDYLRQRARTRRDA